jgi:Tfp pilus assembly protein PilX
MPSLREALEMQRRCHGLCLFETNTVKKSKDVLILGLLAVAIVLLCVMVWAFALAIEVERDTSADLHRTLMAATSALTTAEVQINSIDVNKLNATIGHADKTIADAGATVVHIRKQFDQVDQRTLNTILLHADKVVGHLDQATHDYVANQREVTNKTLDVLDSTDAALKDIRPVLAEANESLKNITATTATVSHTTDQIDKKVTNMLKPASFMKRILTGISSAGAQAFNWLGAIR